MDQGAGSDGGLIFTSSFVHRGCKFDACYGTPAWAGGEGLHRAANSLGVKFSKLLWGPAGL